MFGDAEMPAELWQARLDGLHNGLQLNPSKSEVIQFTAGRGSEQVDDVSSLQVSDAAIQPSPTIKTLGVTLDRLLTFDQHDMWLTCAKPATSTFVRCAMCASLFLMTLLESLPAA